MVGKSFHYFAKPLKCGKTRDALHCLACAPTKVSISDTSRVLLVTDRVVYLDENDKESTTHTKWQTEMTTLPLSPPPESGLNSTLFLTRTSSR